MDHIYEYMATASQDLNYSVAIRAALALGKRTLNRYYDKTDHSEVYRIAMGMLSGWFLPLVILNILYSVLHPCHKLNYFKKAGWDDTWIKTAQEIVHAEFDQTYAFMDVDAGASCKATRKTVSCVHYIWDVMSNSFFQPSLGSDNIFDDLPALAAPSTSELRDDLDRYLSTDPEHVTDALAWWHETRVVYPHLHCMATDYLTIPGLFFWLSDSFDWW